MTDFTRYKSLSRDLQDSVERGQWGALEYVAGAGASFTVRGTGTTDFEVPLMNLGYGFNLPDDSNAEMIMLSLGSDVNDKVVLATLPRDVQHQWGAGEGGVQHPTDPERRLEFNANETHLVDGTFVIGSNREVVITVDGTNVNITTAGTATVNAGSAVVNADTTINGDLSVNGNFATQGGSHTHNGTNVGSTHTHAIAGGLAASVSSGPS